LLKRALFLAIPSVAMLSLAVLPLASAHAAGPSSASPITLDHGWQLQYASRVSQTPARIAAPGFVAAGWLTATVPGTVLTTLVNNHLFPEPLYGENDRPEVIPDSLARESFWYRATFKVPASFRHRSIWLNFEGINYTAQVWINGVEAGSLRGAFIRGRFDVTAFVVPGKTAAVAVLIAPQPHPGEPHEHTLRAGMGLNGGISAIDGPTFLSTIGWDWLPAMRDRDAGIWQPVTLSATGPVTLSNPLVTTDLPLPRTDSADITLTTTLTNQTSVAQRGILRASVGDIVVQQAVLLDPHSTRTLRLDPATTPALHLLHPRLWWPNGYGAQNLYHLHLSFDIARHASDSEDLDFGVRKLTYALPGSDNLAISVNGVPIFIRGGDWGLDEAMKRIPRERLEAEVRLHALAHLNMIRNWVGQSTCEDFYQLCDKYGILLWDEFFQPNPSDGPNPDDLPTYIANVRDKILRFRNHPSIAVWCARNEGYPPPAIDVQLRKLMAELEPTRLYQPSSTEGHGVHSGGPYRWRTPREFYKIDAPFKTETGTVSIPTLESIRAMMPARDLTTINDDWAEHDLARGASGGDKFPLLLAQRYGAFANLADFVRKSQLADYEAFRALYEGRNAALFEPATGVLTWMSSPAHPSFVWQIYSYDLEPFASFFATMHASEPQHIQLNQLNDHIQVINNLPAPLTATAHLAIYNLDGSLAAQREYPIDAPADRALDLGIIDFPTVLTPVHFIRLDLSSVNGETLSTNTYWRGSAPGIDDFTALSNLPTVTLEPTLLRADANGRTTLTVTLHNPSAHIALMTHLQLHRQASTVNYITLTPNETRTLTIEAATTELQGRDAIVEVDGYNIAITPAATSGAAITLNLNAQPGRYPATGLAFQTEGLR
jgi:hypothetical protein